MLAAIGVASFEELIADIPQKICVEGDLELEDGVSETEVLARLEDLAARNRSAGSLVCFAGGGIYDVCVPAAARAIAARPEFATSYTPYQAEVSQGTLQAIYEFQTLIVKLTGLDIANASLYDLGSALAEACMLARAARGGERILVTPHLRPSAREVLATLLEPTGMRIEELPASGTRTDLAPLERGELQDVAAVVLQHPNYYGSLEETGAAGLALSGEDKPLFVVAVDPSSLAILEPPGSYGADIAVGEAQSLGIPMSFGGPGAAIFATREKYLRRVPGRIAGLALDAKGQRAYTLTFQTREQHIRRERATSNICTNQALAALLATVSTALLGETGRRLAARLSAEKAAELARRLTAIDGVELVDPEAPFYREFALRLPAGVDGAALVREMAEAGFLAGILLPSVPGGGAGLLIAVTEKRLWREIDGYAEAFRAALAAHAKKRPGSLKQESRA
jgi:glycine dehydrogenase subunit 1